MIFIDQWQGKISNVASWKGETLRAPTRPILLLVRVIPKATGDVSAIQATHTIQAMHAIHTIDGIHTRQAKTKLFLCYSETSCLRNKYNWKYKCLNLG